MRAGKAATRRQIGGRAYDAMPAVAAAPVLPAKERWALAARLVPEAFGRFQLDLA